jgi:hypothetical protein
VCTWSRRTFCLVHFVAYYQYYVENCNNLESVYFEKVRTYSFSKNIVFLCTYRVSKLKMFTKNIEKVIHILSMLIYRYIIFKV